MEVSANAESRRMERVTYGMLQAELVGFLEQVLQAEQQQPELSEITPQRQQQLDRLKANMPRHPSAGPSRKWKPPDLKNAPRWVISKATKPEPEPEAPPQEPADDVVQVVLGVGDSSFVHSMEYYPKERKVRVSLDTGRKFWFHDVQDDFMDTFRTKMAADGGRGLPQMFTTSAADDAAYGR